MNDLLRRLAGPKPVEMLEVDGASKSAKKGAVEFGALFQDAVTRVDQFQKTNQDLVDRFLRGEEVEVHDMVMAGQRAELAFDMFLQVRNKVVQAYQEVMRMQI